jgi:hypothetical protein
MAYLIAFILFLLSQASAFAQSTTTIAVLPSATAITGTELVPLWQSAATRQSSLTTIFSSITSMPLLALTNANAAAITSLPSLVLTNANAAAITSLPNLVLTNANAAAITSLPNLVLTGLPSLLQPQTGGVSRSTQSVYQDSLSALDFGGVDATGATNSDAGFANFLMACMQGGYDCLIPPGNYKFASSIVIDLKYNTGPLTRTGFAGFRLHGSGQNSTLLTLATGAQILIQNTNTGGTALYQTFDSFGVEGTVTNGPVVKIGQDNFADAINGIMWSNIYVKNLATGYTTEEGLRLNQVYSSTFLNDTVNASCTGVDYYSTGCANGGKSLVLRQAAFNTFTGSYSGSKYGVYITSGYSFGNVFLGLDDEVTFNAVNVDAASAANNTFIGGQFEVGPAYSSTVTAINGSPTIVQTAGNTFGAAQNPPGTIMQIAGVSYVVLANVDSTHVTLTVSYAGTTGSKTMTWGGTNACTFNFSAGSSNVVLNANYSPYQQPAVCSGGSVGLQIAGGSASLVTTPAFPATTVSYANTTGRNISAQIYSMPAGSTICYGAAAATCLSVGTAGLITTLPFKTTDTLKFTYASGSPAWVLTEMPF